jgi:ketosteroid isomerase-like protein
MQTDIEQEVLTQEEFLTLSTRKLDIQALDRIYADDILMTGVLGETCGKASLMDEAKRGIAHRESAAAAGKHFESSYDKEDLKIALLGDAAVTSYRFVVKIQGADIDVHRRYRTTNVWAKRNGHWQVVAAHTAFVLDPKQVAGLEKEGARSRQEGK